MKICVLVKAVPDAARRVVSETGRLDRSGEGGLSSGDRYATEAALQLREGGAFGTVEVVVVTMGPPSADRALRRALAMGCDRGVHLCDQLLEGSDVIGTGYALACLLRSEDPGMVLLGETSSDAGSGVLAAVVGEFLDVPVVTAARSVNAADGGLLLEQISEFGRLRIRVKGPAVISIGADANTPRYASLRETMEARSRPVDTVHCDDLGIEPEAVGSIGAAVSCGQWHEPPPRTAGTVVEPESVDAAVQAILGWLEAEKLA